MDNEILTQVLPAMAAIVGAATTGYITYKISSNQIVANNRIDECKKIREDLQNFYLPLYELLEKNKFIYDIFRLNNYDDGSTLSLLLNEKYKFNNNDVELLKLIIENNNKINNLIFLNSGRVFNKDLMKDLSELSTHFLIIDLAYNKKIKSDFEKFEKCIYPEGVDKKISKEIEILKEKCKQLNEF